MPPFHPSDCPQGSQQSKPLNKVLKTHIIKPTENHNKNAPTVKAYHQK